MSIYHFGQMKIISRGTGRSVIASSAYISAEKIHNDYDGITHDYTRKTGVVYKEIMLCENAPKEWKERKVLWNEVEKIETSKNSQLARSFEVALQTEFTLEENKKIIQEYVKENFVKKGMCADICIHDKDGSNPHAHVILTMRKVKENGEFEPKAEKQYKCRNSKGEEKYFNSYELKKNKDFEKLYKCKHKKDVKELTNSDLKKEEYKEYKKVSKYPLDRKIDKCSDWNDKNNINVWRENWAKINNLEFERKGLKERIDHRSYEEQGIEKVPTIHEGSIARQIQKRGRKSYKIKENERRKEVNNTLEKINKLIKELENDIRKDNPDIKFTNNIKEDLNILKEHFEKTRNFKKLWEVEKQIDILEKLNIETEEKVIEFSKHSKDFVYENYEKLESINKQLKIMDSIEDEIYKLDSKVYMIDNKIEELSSGFTGKLRNRNEIKQGKEYKDKLLEDIKELKGKLNKTDRKELINKKTKLESELSSSENIRRNIDGALETYKNKEDLIKPKEQVVIKQRNINRDLDFER